MENNSQEVWKPIDGFEGLYEVSNLGRVKSLDRYVDNGHGSTRLAKGRILKPQLVMGGYLQVILCRNCKPSLFKVHRLVYEAFHGKRPEGMEINHIDEDKSNNSLENLNLMTHKENVNWGTAIERRAKPIIQYSLNGKKLAEFDSLSDASNQLNIKIGNISSTLNGKRKTAGGYKWKYKE